MFRQVPLGYEKSWKIKKVIIHESEAEIVRSVFYMAVDGMSSGRLYSDFMRKRCQRQYSCVILGQYQKEALERLARKGRKYRKEYLDA